MRILRSSRRASSSGPSRPSRSMIRAGGDVEQCLDDLRGREGNERDVGAGNGLFGTIGEDALEVRKLRFHVLAVGTDQGRGVEDRVVNADLVALAQQGLCQVDVGALTEVVATGLEAQTQQGDPMALAGNDSVDGFVDRQPVARQCAGEQRYVDALAPCQIEEGAKVLWKA